MAPNHSQTGEKGGSSGNKALLMQARAKFEESMIDLVQIGTKYSNGNLHSFVANVPRMIELLKSEFNQQLLAEKTVEDLWI